MQKNSKCVSDSVQLQEEADKIIKKALDDGILEKVTVPTDWISPGFFVPKEGGKACVYVYAWLQIFPT